MKILPSIPHQPEFGHIVPLSYNYSYTSQESKYLASSGSIVGDGEAERRLGVTARETSKKGSLTFDFNQMSKFN